MKQLRIYTIKDQEHATLYYEKHWQRHLVSLPKYHILVDDVVLEQSQDADANCRVFAIVHVEDGWSLDKQNALYMKSADFKADMAGFPMSAIVSVEQIACR